MASQFFGLMIAGSGLRSANASMNTTANNIANAETKGYSRQLVSLEAQQALRTFTTYGCAGAGVDVIAIERARDSFYDVKYRNNNTNLGTYEIKQYYQEQIELFLRDDGKSGFSTLFSTMMNSLQEVMKKAGDGSTKADFVSDARSITEYFNTMAADMENIQRDANEEIKLTVDTINSIASTIATINEQINTIEMTGSRANTLRDKRDTLVDDLSKLVRVETIETPIVDPRDPERETGGTRYIVKIAGGATLVDGSGYQTLECTARTTKINQSDIDGLYELAWSNGNEFPMTNPSIGGKLQGLLESRDGNNGFYFHGTVRDVQPGGAGYHLVKVEVGNPDLADLNKSTLPNSGEIQLGTKTYAYDSWVLDEATGTFTFKINDAKCDSIVGVNSVGKDAAVGYDMDYQGVPYYMQQMNEWIRSFSQMFNGDLQAGYTSKGEAGTWLFTGNDLVGTQYALDLNNGAIDKLAYYNITAYNFAINDAIVKDSSLLASKTNATAGVDSYDLIKALHFKISDKDAVLFRGSSASEFLDCILSDVALNADSAATFTATYINMETTISNQRLSVSGVDQEEEAVNLVKFQNNYNLASKMVQTLTEVYDRLILETGV